MCVWGEIGNANLCTAIARVCHDKFISEVDNIDNKHIQ